MRMLGIPVITPENIRAWKLSSDLDYSRMFERISDSLTEIYRTQKNKYPCTGIREGVNPPSSCS